MKIILILSILATIYCVENQVVINPVTYMSYGNYCGNNTLNLTLMPLDDFDEVCRMHKLCTMSQFMGLPEQTLMICSYLAMKFIENINPYSDITSDIKMNILAATPVYPIRPGGFVLSSEGYYRIIPNNALTTNKGFYILFNNESLTYKIIFEFDSPAIYVMTLDNMITDLNYTSPMIYGTKIVNQNGTSLAPKFVSNSKLIIISVYDNSNSTFSYNKFMITKVTW